MRRHFASQPVDADDQYEAKEEGNPSGQVEGQPAALEALCIGRVVDGHVLVVRERARRV